MIIVNLQRSNAYLIKNYTDDCHLKKLQATCGTMARQMAKLQAEISQKDRLIKEKYSSNASIGISRCHSNFFSSLSTRERGSTLDWNMDSSSTKT